jgi:hypothetical protein
MKPKPRPQQQKQKLDVSARRTKIVGWIEEGLTQTEMAQRSGVSQQQISLDYAAIIKDWREERCRFLDDQKTVIERQIMTLYRKYHAGWERSLQPRKQTQTRAVEGTGARREAGQTEEQRTGDPRFLDGMRNCLRDVRELWGLDAPASIPLDLTKCTDDQLRLLGASMPWELVAQLTPEQARAIPTPHLGRTAEA